MLSSLILDTAAPVPLPMLTPAELKALLVLATQGIFTGRKTGEKDPFSQTSCSLPVVDTDTPFGKQLIRMAGKVEAARQGMGELEDELGQSKEQLEAVKANREHWKEKREEIQRAIH